MKTKIAVVLALALAVPAVAVAGKPGKPELWGKLNPRKAGAWARFQVMRKGFLAGLIRKSEKKHPAFAKLMMAALKELNSYHGKCHGRWPNVRLALANLAAGAARGAGTALAPALKEATAAIGDACPKVGKGGLAAIARGLDAGAKQLAGKAKPFFMRHLRTAKGWLGKGNLWAVTKKPVAKPEAGAKPAEQAKPEAEPAKPAEPAKTGGETK